MGSEVAGVDDVVVLERGERVGGTWRDNTYPGAACDIPSLLYSFSFAPAGEGSCPETPPFAKWSLRVGSSPLSTSNSY